MAKDTEKLTGGTFVSRSNLDPIKTAFSLLLNEIALAEIDCAIPNERNAAASTIPVPVCGLFHHDVLFLACFV